MIPSGYLLLGKIGAVIVLLLGVYLTGRHQGEDAVQADWDRSKAQFIDAQSKLILEHAREMEDLRKKQDATNIQVSQDHQEALDAIQQKHDAELAAVRANGLRIPKTVCSNTVTTGTETTSPGGSDDNTSDSVALPEQTSRDLLDLAAEADRTTEIARSCQSWIIKNGFYSAQ
jgi:hypothetical protein